MDRIAEEELHWDKDILGAGFSAATLSFGRDPDGEGEAVATLVRADAPVATAASASAAQAGPGKPAVLWIHGMTDYFSSGT
ncbi:hypothetical protein [Corynebacterium oculi]|uniref:Alpha/beta hydrolase family protein n=1 Tax=Corynebacterium oculi TaxID=1544416 RepID=A0A0Q0U0Y7_9CORY|nr:hypothetical protein [Corynebacterium oculi]KQB85351.1 hypothetical protein Cocul_00490 [Corynebacterium oculi]